MEQELPSLLQSYELRGKQPFVSDFSRRLRHAIEKGRGLILYSKKKTSGPHGDTPVLTQLFFPKPPTTFLRCFCRGERRKFARKKVASTGDRTHKQLGHESDTLTTEPPGRGPKCRWNSKQYTGLWDMSGPWYESLRLSFQGLMIAIATRLLFSRTVMCKSSQWLVKNYKVRSSLLINPFQNNSWLLRVYNTGLLKTLWEKEKLLVTSNFSFSRSVFYPFGELSAIFIKLKNCRLQTLSVWKSLKFVIWEKVKEI